MTRLTSDRPVTPATDTPTLVRLLCAIVGVLIAAGFRAEFWQLHATLMTLIFIAMTLDQVPLSYLNRRLALFVPWMAALALAFPAMHGFRGGWEPGATVFLRGLVSFLAAIWLARAIPFRSLTRALRRLRVPVFFVHVLEMMHRYLLVLWEELHAMQTARRARTMRPVGVIRRWTLHAQTLGMLLIRSLRRAERVHAAMSARGWEMHSRHDDHEVGSV